MKNLPTCKEIHQLTSKQLDQELTSSEHTRQRLHLFVCGGCRNFVKQMALLREAMQHMSTKGTTSPVNSQSSDINFKV